MRSEVEAGLLELLGTYAAMANVAPAVSRETFVTLTSNELALVSAGLSALMVLCAWQDQRANIDELMGKMVQIIKVQHPELAEEEQA